MTTTSREPVSNVPMHITGGGCGWCADIDDPSKIEACVMAIHFDEIHPDAWFPEDAPYREDPDAQVDPETDLYDSEEAAEAIDLCGVCVIKDLCLERALTAEAGKPETHRAGIYGGITPLDRIAIEQDRASKTPGVTVLPLPVRRIEADAPTLSA